MTAQLSAEALQLLPAVDESPRCASHARAMGVDPRGTAIRADAVLVVELARPWPKPVFAHPHLSTLSSMMELSCGPTRVLAAEPREGAAATGGITLFERAEVGMTSTSLTADPDDVASLVTDLQHQPAYQLSSYEPRPGPDLALLVCTQGSHDVCCGSDGMRFANEIEAAAPGLAVYRVSHTGGHRFAPTAMTLPDGRMWAGMDVAECLSTLDLTGDPAELSAQCRGWWGAATGAEQVAEVALFAELGWDLDTRPRFVDTVAHDTGWTVRIDVADQPYWAEVAVGRDVPTITCRAEGGLPAKRAVEYEVTSLTLAPSPSAHTNRNPIPPSSP